MTKVRISLRTLRHLERQADTLARLTMPAIDRADPYRPDIKIAGNIPSTATRTLRAAAPYGHRLATLLREGK